MWVLQVKKKKFKLDKDNGPSSPDRMLAIPHITYDHVAEDRKPDFSFEPFENSGKKLHYKMPVTVMSSVIRFAYRSFLVSVVKKERTSSCLSNARILCFFAFGCWLSG